MTQQSNENNIPKHWQVKKLGEVCKLKNGFAFKSTDYQEYGIPVIRISDINQGIVSGEDSVKVESKDIYDNYLVENNDILVAMSGATTGKFGIYKSTKKAYQNQRVGKFKILDEKILDNQFLFHQINSLKRQIEKDAYGGAQPNISSNKIEQMEIVLPPLSEQLAIVSKIEELLSDLENGKQQLLTAQQQLKVYRQSLLKVAFEGRLTNKEVKDGELPKGWKLVEIGTICKCIVPNRDKPKSFTGDIKWVTTPNLSSSSIKLDYPSISMGLSENETVEYNARVIPSGSVIMTCVGTFGLSAVIEKPVVINQQLHAFLSSDLVNPKYLAYCIQNSKSYFEHKSTSTTIQYLNKSNCNSMPFPLTSIEEQNQIVEILESKLTVCDKIEETISQSLLQAEILKQSILKKAFEGQLV
jgi:type I restriction enzyme S subunit